MNRAHGRIQGGIIFLSSVAAAIFWAVGAPGSAGLNNLINTLADPGLAFAQRSPGERPAGTLADTKTNLARGVKRSINNPAKKLTLPFVPENWPQPDNSLGEERPSIDRTISTAPNGLRPDISSTNSPDSGSTPLGNDNGISQPGTYVPPAFGVPPAEVPPVTIPPGNVAEVPEPATWSTMIIGFFSIGWVLRRERHRTVVPRGVSR